MHKMDGRPAPAHPTPSAHIRPGSSADASRRLQSVPCGWERSHDAPPPSGREVRFRTHEPAPRTCVLAVVTGVALPRHLSSGAAGARATLGQVPRDALISYEPAGPDGTVRASLDGELDLDCADQVRDSLAEAARQPGCRHLRVDVSGLTFIDSYALGALVSARNTAVAAGVALTLADPSPPVRKAGQVTGLADMFGLPTAG